jgi:hypothetical protein
MAASRIIINLSRWSASDSGEEEVVIMIGKTGATPAFCDHASSKLFLKVRGLELVFCVGDGGDFMVVTVVLQRFNDEKLLA